MMEAVRTSETSAYFKETIRRYIPEVSKLAAVRTRNLTQQKAVHICCRN
jgi:hypothetical protein